MNPDGPCLTAGSAVDRMRHIADDRAMDTQGLLDEEWAALAAAALALPKCPRCNGKGRYRLRNMNVKCGSCDGAGAA